VGAARLAWPDTYGPYGMHGCCPAPAAGSRVTSEQAQPPGRRARLDHPRSVRPCVACGRGWSRHEWSLVLDVRTNLDIRL
jgi:hypothetical protein